MSIILLTCLDHGTGRSLQVPRVPRGSGGIISRLRSRGCDPVHLILHRHEQISPQAYDSQGRLSLLPLPTFFHHREAFLFPEYNRRLIDASAVLVGPAVALQGPACRMQSSRLANLPLQTSRYSHTPIFVGHTSMAGFGTQKQTPRLELVFWLSHQLV